MDLLEAIQTRHAVRAYTGRKIEGDVLDQLRRAIDDANEESGLHMQLCVDAPQAFAGIQARYGKLVNVRNYIALVGQKGSELEELCGYYGEKVVLEATRLGLQTCWVAATFSRSKCVAAVNRGEKLLMVIAVGYGQTMGVAHTGKPIEALYRAQPQVPDWFLRGVQSAQRAPTALNQQKFCFSLDKDAVTATAGKGVYTKADLGIAKYHFEVGAGDAEWYWAN